MRKGSASPAIYRLIYYSRHGFRLPDLRTEMEAIVAAARVRNAADQITGCLMCSAAGFAQALEGARDAIERTFDRVSDDPRHSDVMLLSLTPVERLGFPDRPLAMLWRAEPAESDPLAPLFAPTAIGSLRATTGSDVLRILRSAVTPLADPFERPVEGP